ncbi:TetR/AcrR family transcriptional regulator [Actinosynnema pretiosum subsp. pretiosum]|uniref:Transcriptional regulator, TetR family n=2 Tax=Actinosynnema TaxID=40566 RepID=C6WBT1_ACTMD|nr:TetR/AcrR family transcriptional regulator [Actinosynnema mirum]ACU37498.1 transcriptional regulator, TetR family [Actinosynnema mirum DSM 43827]AXX30979.1 Transcriptional regulator, TetR family [Actinosynnema pretiosum subsp. pretiosum]QUF04931.1 TetR/AcrR family transcriptional regulator [Actinosynnema pretiosum subsp. pretiosum]
MSLRERRRAAATREILDAAKARMSEHGPAGLALRAVARDLDMTVQALYHYFPSRDDLLTALIVEAYEDLAAAVRTALDAAPPEPFPAVAEAFRTWAIEHRAQFQLIYGTPLPHYRAPHEGPTTEAARKVTAVLRAALFDGCAEEALARADAPELTPELRARLAELPPEARGELPPPAAALFLDAWARLHGLVVLEAFGHFDFLAPLQAEVFRGAVRSLAADVRRRVPG